MTARKKTKSKSNDQKKICEATLKLASTQQWNTISLEQVSKTAKVPLSQLQSLFSDTPAILPFIVHLIDAETADSIGKPDFKASPHDRLFEVMMARFDQLQLRRKAVLNIMAATKRIPRMLRYLAPAQWQAMRHMLALAGLNPEGGKEAIVIAGLYGLYGLSLCTWQKDDSIDMARTMATLDRYLRHADRIGSIIFHFA